MEKNILIRYNEIHLKGKNRGFFEELLYKNIKNALFEFNAELKKVAGRYILSGYEEKDERKILNRLCQVAGVYSVSPAYVVDTNYEKLSALVTGLLKDENGTFKINTNRADKTFMQSSMQISSEIGGDCLESNKNLSVDLHNPEHVINIDVRENGKTFVYNKTMMGVGGMPVGSSGKGLVLLSGGIDSPVSCYLMNKRGVKLAAVHFHSYPYTSNLAREKVEKLAKILTRYNGDFTIYMVNVAKIQEAIRDNCHSSFLITLLRRFMYRISEKIAKDHHIPMIVTGENLGQVASQTIESMTVIENVIDSTVVLRPLITFDKIEIIDIARKIDTYETSIEPFEDCCTVFLPKDPVTKPKLENVLKEESKLDVEKLMSDALATIEKVVISNKES